MQDGKDIYDLIVVGGGAAGLSASIYGGRARLRTLVINKGAIGGMAETTREIVNYPGYASVSGPDLMRDFQKHAESFGVEFLKDQVVAVELMEEPKRVRTKKKEFLAKAVILAVGSEPRLLDIPGEKEFQGSGVAYCATCDAQFFEGEDVVVVGSGDQAIEEGMFITKFARKVTIIVLHDPGKLDCNKVSAERAFKHEKLEFVWNSTIEAVLGEESVRAVKIKNIRTGASSELSCQGVFFFVGMTPATRFLKGSGLAMDERGYIPVNELMETNLEGVYAIGDSRIKYLRQVVTAAGDGATSAVAAERYIEEREFFCQEVIHSPQKVLLVFVSTLNSESIEFCTLLEEANRELSDHFKVAVVDSVTKKNLVRRYNVAEVPTVVVLQNGQELQRLDCSVRGEKLKSQLMSISQSDAAPGAAKVSAAKMH